ncbi:MAG: hypothetical protein ABI169_05475, partial [Chitinophagaceae bacterium]
IMLLLTISTISIMGSALSKSKHVFFIGAMAKRGVLQAYLAEHCPTDSFRICAYRSEIVTNNNDFIWNDNSPLYKSGGWDANKEDFNRIIKGSITEPRFIKMQIATSIIATGQQLVQFHMGDGNIPFGPETGLQQDVQQYLPKDIPRMNAAAQQQARLLPILEKLNIVYDVLIPISLLVFLVGCIFRWKKLSSALRFLLILLGISVLLNAWDCATFSGTIDRYGCKMIFLIPLMAVLVWGSAFRTKAITMAGRNDVGRK